MLKTLRAKALMLAVCAAPLAMWTGTASAAPIAAAGHGVTAPHATANVVQAQYRRGPGWARGGGRYGRYGWRGRGWRGPGFGLGVAAGALAGAALGAPYYYPDYNTGYAAPSECYIDDGAGRYRPCDSAP